MPQELRLLVEQFYDLAVRYGDKWPDLTKLPPQENTIIQQIVASAGYEIVAFRNGRIHTYDPTTGAYYNVNNFFPYIVVGKDGDDNWATDFVDLIAQVVVLGGTKYSKKAIVDGITVEINGRANRNKKGNLRG